MKRPFLLDVLEQDGPLKFVQDWDIEQPCKINFMINGVLNNGYNCRLSGLQGNMFFDERNLERSRFNLGIDLNTLKTGNEVRDEMLKTAEYFEVKRYPYILFKSSTVKRNGMGFLAEGDLTVKNIARKVEIPFTFDTYNEKGVFAGNFKINRLDYKIGRNYWNLTDMIHVNINIPVNKSK